MTSRSRTVASSSSTSVTILTALCLLCFASTCLFLLFGVEHCSSYEILDIPVYSRDKRSLVKPTFSSSSSVRRDGQLTDDEQGVTSTSGSLTQVDDGGNFETYVDSDEKSSTRVKRDVSRYGATQHLRPPKEITPLPRGPRVKMPTLPFRDVAGYVERATAAVNRRFEEIEPAIFNNGVRQTPGSPAWFMSATAKTKVVSKNISRIALISEEATKFLARDLKLDRNQITYGLPTADVRGTVLGEECPVQVDFPCQPRKYRAYNGYCNNVQNPRWGNANTRYLRFLPAEYSDGVSTPRQAVSGEFLRSAREVSLILHGDVDQPHPHMTAISAVWADFLYHDISHTPQMAGYLGQRIRCCGILFENFHPECYPIRIPETDPYYGSYGERCQEYVRSGNAPRTACTLGPREQINQVTAFLDGSVIYGSSKEEVLDLRAGKGGLLSVQNGPAGDLPPADPSILDCRTNGSTNLRCFKTGDVRANEDLGLASMHSLWVREHNRVARILTEINPHWGDEQAFQEARRIVGAELQHITYHEFLPNILGQDIVDQYGLSPQKSGFFTGYDININPGVSNSVGAAAMRFVASLMSDKLPFIDSEGQLAEIPVGNTFFAPFELYTPGKIEALLRGLVESRAQTEDPFIAGSMTNHLFYDPTTGVGLDLASQIIQQGRDHGIAGYNSWRVFCGLPKAATFRDFLDVMSQQSVDALKTVYNHVDDIDLFSGGLAETPNRGALVGPTFGCLLGRQYHYLRRGDRYWYENDIPPSSFTKEQLYEIRKTSLARVICDNTNLDLLQPHVFINADSFLNAPMACHGSTLKAMDLSAWRTASPNFIVPGEVLQNSVDRAKRDLGAVRDVEWELWNQHVKADPKSAIGTAYAFLRPKRNALTVSNTSFILEFATRRFVKNLVNERGRPFKDLEGGSKAPQNLNDLMVSLPNIDVSDVMEIPHVFDCDEQTLPCDHTSRWPSFTGWCNNLQHPEFGKSTRAFARLLRPAYLDGIGEPRTRGVRGNPLPTPRKVSMTVHEDVSHLHARYTLMTMQFGQFLDHDITFTPVNKGFGESILDCKRCDGINTIHPECMPITIPADDPWYPKTNDTGSPFCLSFTRSLPGQLTLGYREQVNQVTAFVDGSSVYGSDLCESRTLRSFKSGQLRVLEGVNLPGKPLMPRINTDKECKAPSGFCFTAGDGRSNEQPGLATMHTIWMRQHNQLAEGLAKVNVHWSDEAIYQNARRILAAQLQHVTYNEFLPRVLGWNAINLYKLNLVPDGYSDGYDRTCNPTVLNEFATAAFRFGHSLLRPDLKRMDRNYVEIEPSLQLRDFFFNPDKLYDAGLIDELLRGFATVSTETLDNTITIEVTQHLFENKKKPFSGLDLAAANIQRGRDHGLQPYNAYRKLCNLTYARDFKDLEREISLPMIERLQLLYEDVNDIDLFSGALSETPLHGGMVGPTFGCIIGIQFKNVMKCDRFWYENRDPLIRFTEGQLSEIRETTMAKIVCSNSDNIHLLQRSVFDLPDPFLNPRVPCDSMPSIDYSLWQERQNCNVGPKVINVGEADRISPCVMCTCTKEGPICQSLRIDNCFHLARTFSPQDILEDHVCKVQCAFAFRAFPKVKPSAPERLG